MITVKQLTTLIIILKTHTLTLKDNCLSSKECRECVRGNCLKCRYGYRNQSNLCNLIKYQIQACVSYLHEGYCIECDKGWYVDSGFCSRCKDKDCAVCPQNTCIACFNNVKMENSCGNKKCSVKNCDICFFNDFCMVCKEGFALKKMIGGEENFDCVETSHNCLTLAGNTDKCSTCDVNRVLDQDSYCVSSSARLFFFFLYSLLFFV